MSENDFQNLRDRLWQISSQTYGPQEEPSLTRQMALVSKFLETHPLKSLSREERDAIQGLINDYKQAQLNEDRGSKAQIDRGRGPISPF